MKGFKTSKDYEKLYDLARAGYRIPAWILYKEEPLIFDIVEVKRFKFDKYISIGTRGRGYETFNHSKKAFIENCESLKLEFIMPSII